MELSLTATHRFGSQNHFSLPLEHNPQNHHHLCPIPISTKLKKLPNTTKTTLRVSAKKKSTIEGISDELNSIASLNLDFAPSRRQVREAFTHVHQQLDHFLFKTAPAGIITQEWYERNSRGLEIFCKSWMPEHGVAIKGALFFCHGYGSTCTFFFEGIARRIAASGFGVFAMDFPGFGLSEGLHGYIPSFDDLVDDAIEFYTKIKARPEVRDLPQFIFGQSMGGAIALKAHLKQPNDWDGVILVAPMCKISEGMLPSTTILKVLTFLSKMMPKAKLFPYKDLTALIIREPGKRKWAGYNVISYDDQTRLRTGMELLRATQDIESRLEKVSAPLLILHGAEDKVTDPLVSQYLYEKASSKDKTLKIYEGGYHGIMEGEPDERISAVHSDIISWLEFRCTR
ncbi:caffeoylshikimate esterase-like isoform X1 [Trifolium pratense]|uniref:caffeoylshikimate esterase-like isoform X1 n=1 Tax=Trifolium pratense TaxID=57577 RepID=UPI001E695762|nr:caffeoylshikimate esterase-like isoform X1 [Trifolium pratense]